MIVTQTLVGNWLNLIQLKTKHRKTENLTKLILSPNTTPYMAISPLLFFLLLSFAVDSFLCDLVLCLNPPFLSLPVSSLLYIISIFLLPDKGVPRILSL